MHPLATAARRARLGILATTTAAALLAATGAAHAAEVIYATTPGNDLIRFTSQAPARILSREPISGLAASETIVGMDRRPSTGQLYVLSSTGRVLVVDRDSGDTRVITPTAIPLTGTTFGFDFNPVADAIRITSDTDINLRVNPDTGAVAGTDGAIAYGAGDAGAGSNPTVGAAGYTFSAFGAPPASTELFGIDTARNTFVKQDPPNAGTLTTVGALGEDAVDQAHLDIAGDTTRYAAFAVAGSSVPRLWRINAAGAASPAGSPSTLGAPAITAMTTVGKVRDDVRAPLVAVGNYTTYRGIWLDRGLRFTVSCTEDCTTTVTLRIDGTIAGTATATMPFAGTRPPRITLNAAGRRLAAQGGRIEASLTFDNVDLAGNTRRQVSTFNSLPGFNSLM